MAKTTKRFKNTKKARFNRSQKMHNRLHFKFFSKSIGNPHNELKADYHHEVAVLQRHANKILPKSERKIIYGYNKQAVFGGKDKVKRSDYLAIFRKYKVD